jgi:hypothetical protein
MRHLSSVWHASFRWTFSVGGFGDHQPMFAKRLSAAGTRSREGCRAHPGARSPLFHRLLRLEGLNFEPADLTSALELLDAPYLPPAVLEAAGVPVDGAFSEQKKILNRCGVYSICVRTVPRRGGLIAC